MRLAAAEVSRQGGQLRRGLTRMTTHLVFGRKLLSFRKAAEIELQYIERQVAAATAAGVRLLSESAFLEVLGLKVTAEQGSVSRASLVQQSRLPSHLLNLLSLFDAFEHGQEPYSFRDLILARKYAGLVSSGADWLSIARAVHRADSVPSLTALTLQTDASGKVVAAHGGAIAELDGQRVLPLVDQEQPDPDDLFASAEEAVGSGDYAKAARLYRHCLTIDPTDAVTAFDLGNALRSAGELDEASSALALAIKLDPAFVEAWFNLADILRGRGKTEAARRHLERAIALDPEYADAVFNLATLEFGAERLIQARRWWERYLELDGTSDWALQARRGIQYVDRAMTLPRRGRQA